MPMTCLRFSRCLISILKTMKRSNLLELDLISQTYYYASLKVCAKDYVYCHPLEICTSQPTTVKGGKRSTRQSPVWVSS